MFETAQWFGESATGLTSFCYVALRTEQAFGLLAMASDDPARFSPDMGTVYVKRLGELMSVAAARFLKPA
jgi:hypothetical protein